jgi:hypothetical protein
VREGGVLIVRSGARFDPGNTLAQTALAFGYSAESRICETGHKILIARKDMAGQVRKVA